MTGLPKKIGKYRIQSLLGSGAMGVVYQGFDPDIKRTVAIKVLHSHLMSATQGESIQDRFRREAQAAAKCSHPMIVAVYELGHDTGRDFIVMEYVQGEELKYFLTSGHEFSLLESLHIIAMVLEGLEAAHKRNIIHRDIKPANIILLDTGEIKIADFGVAKIDTSDLTVAGNMIGTPGYMSPEGLCGKEVDNRADLYSTGMVLFEMLTGEKPTPEERFNQPISSFADKVFNRGRGSELSPSIKDILLRALADKKDDRYQDATDFLIAVQHEESDISAAKPAVDTLAETVVSQRPLIKPKEHSKLDEDFLKELEKGLTSYIGPMAKLLLKRSTTTEQTPQSLIEDLARHIDSTTEREEFLILARRCIKEDTNHDNKKSTAQSSTDTPSIAETISVEKLTNISQILAYYVGPMASRIVNQEALRSYNLAELHHALAEKIPGSVEKEEFLKKISG